MNKYWVQYQYGLTDHWVNKEGEQRWTVVSDFITTDDLEVWWEEESSGLCPHEILQVVKL